MLFVDNRNLTDPRMNLALEEFLLRRVTLDDTLFLLYVNEPAVILGRNQNVLEEVNLEYTEAQGIHVIRRISGGGAVYHDLGNLNFSFITNDPADIQNFAKFTGPIIDALNGLGVPAEFRHKSDIYLGEKKISGNAQFASGRRVMSHGTVLFDTYLPTLRQAIKPNKEGIKSSAVASRRSSVVNTCGFMGEGTTLADLKGAILRQLFGAGEVPRYELSEADWTAVQEMSQKRYHQWTWNIGRSPNFTVTRNGRLPLGTVQIEIDVRKGHISALSIAGEFLGEQDLQPFYDDLVGARYDRGGVSAVLEEIDLSYYFGLVDIEDLLGLLY